MAIRFETDAFGWILIRSKGETLQAFKTEKECRQWVADSNSILLLKGEL